VRPTIPPHLTQVLRWELIAEEFEELKAAITLKDMTLVADALGDLLYVVLGTANAYGLDMEPIFWEIHRSNLSKFIDGHRREDGKWVKGKSYSPANLGPIIKQQEASA
jgi:predicted HAD superfamily Cof-like phosphohydrolase